MRQPLPLVFTALAIVPCLLAGCGHGFLSNGIDEGEIEYAMSFPDLDPNGLMSGMLPEKTILSFNKEHQSLDLSAGMGVFRTSMVVNTPKKELDYHMSVMGKNLMATLRPWDLQSLNHTVPGISVIYTNAVDTIAGYPCKQAFVVYESIDRPEEEVWYTTAIPMEDPNWYGPFGEIPGVLMRYNLMQNNIRVHMEATRVRACAVDPLKFKDRPDHQQVSPKELYTQLDEVLGTFAN